MLIIVSMLTGVFVAICLDWLLDDDAPAVRCDSCCRGRRVPNEERGAE